MSEVDKIKPLLDSVQNDFVATLNANPSLTDQELIKKFPELNEFAKYGVPVNQSVSYLRQYYADTKSGKYQDLTSLKNDYSVDSFVAKKTPVQTEPKSQPKADPIDAVQNDFVATMNANPSLTDQQILEKFPEIKTGWQNPQEGIDYLRSYYADTKSGKYQDLASLKEAYSLKKKDTTQQTTTPLDGNQFQAPTSDTSQATSLLPSETGKPKSPLALGGSTLGLEGTGLESQGQLPETVLPSTGAEQQSYLGPYKAGLGISDPSQVVTSRPTETQRERDTLKKFPSVDQLIDDTIPIPQYGQVQNADTNSLLMNSDTGKPFGSSVAKKDLLESQRAEAETGVLSGITQDITKQSNKFYEDAFDQKLSTMLGLPADVVQQNKEEWAFKSKVAGQGEESGMTQDDIAVRDRYANNYVRKNADLIRDEYFDDLTSKLGSSAPEYWKKKGNEIAVSYLTENDLAIKDLKDKITTLEATENRTPQQEIELKKYKGTLDTLVDIKYTGKDLFTDNGAFIANKKIQIEDQGKFIDSVNKYAAIYDGTDKATLTKERDNAYFQYLYAQNMRNDIYEKQVELQSQNPGDNSLRQEWINAGKYAEDRLAYFMGINRALLLNEDPGTGAEDTFFTGIAEGFKEAMGIESQSASALRDHAITGIQAAGYEATEDQLDKAGQDFFEKAGRSVGSSLPIMAEIGVNLLLTNKIAGALAIPKLAQTLAGGNKMKQFGLNLIYDTASQSLAFAASGESGFAGAGEGVGQALGTAILGRFGVTNKLANIGVRLATGTATETMAEYAGEFVDEAQKNGWDLQKASEVTFGKTADEAIEKLGITLFVAGTLGAPGAVLGSGNGNENSFLFATEGMKEIQKSNSDSPIVKTLQENDFTKVPTEEETAKKDEILEKKSAGEPVTEEELNQATLTETREEFQKTKEVPADNAPVISKPSGQDTEYTFTESGETGFVSEKELITKLDDEKFVQSVSEGKVGLNVINPSPEVEAKIAEKFPVKTEVTQPGIQPELESKTQPVSEPVSTTVSEPEAAKTESAPEVKTDPTEEFTTPKLNTIATFNGLTETRKDDESIPTQKDPRMEGRNSYSNGVKTEDGVTHVTLGIYDNGGRNGVAKISFKNTTGKTDSEILAEINKIDTSLKNSDYVAAAEKVLTSLAPVKTELVSEVKTEPTPTVKPEQLTLSEGSKTSLPPRISGGMAQKMEYVNGEWKQEVGGKLIDVSETQQEEAQKAFDKQSKVEVNEAKTETKTETKTSLLESEKKPAGETDQKEKKIKEASKKLAEKVRSGKIKISLDKFSTSPKPIIDALVNTALEAVALSIELGGTITQAVADGMRVIQNSDWFKSLTEEQKEEVQDQIAQQLTDQLEAESEAEVEKPAPKKKERIKDVKTQPKETPGSNKTDSKNKAFAERLGTQTNLNQETKDKILKDAANDVQNQKELLKQTTDMFNQIMKETDGNYEEVLKVADGNVSAGHKELLYAHVMQHLANLEQSSDPSVSKAASNRLIELGRVIADRLNESGKQIAAMATVYKNFPMYEFYQKLAMVEKMNSNTLDKTNNRTAGERVTNESIKEEATRDIESIIKDIEDNFTELFNDARFEKVIAKLQAKLDGKKRPRNLSDQKKKELKDRKKAVLNKFFGRTGTLQATLPGIQQIGAIIEYAAILIEEGYYRSKDIVADIKEAFNSNGANLTDQQIKSALDGLKQFREILKNEEVTTRRDSFDEIMKLAIRQYLKEGLKISNMTMDQALVSSDANIKQIKQNVIESLKNTFDLTEQEAKSAIDAIDQVFREKAVQKLKKKFDKFYPAVSPKKAHQKKEVDKIADDVSLGALDTTFEFMNMAFQKYGLLDLNNPRVVNDIRSKALKITNAPEGVLKNQRRKELATYLHKLRGGYGFKDWIMSRFYADILSGPLTHLKNLKYNSVAIGLIAPLTQMYTTGANPISTWKEMRRSFLESDRKVAAHYVKTGNDFIDPNVGPKAYVDALEFNLIRNGYSKLLNLASTRMLAASDMVLTRPLSSAIYRNHVKAYLRTEKGLKGKELESAASELMGYTEENVKKSSEQALQDIKDHYGFDPFTEETSNLIKREASILLLLRTQERILENSGIEEKIGTDAWLDIWNGESLIESSDKEAKNMALTGETLGTVGILTSLLDKVTDKFPLLKFKVPFSRVIGNMLNLGIKWAPGVGMIQAGSRYFINKGLNKKGMPTTSSSLLYLINRTAPDSVVDSKFMKSLNKEISYRQAKRDFINSFVIAGVQALIYALMAKDDEDEGFVITGALDPSFYLRGSITKGTGIVPWGVYYRNPDGEMTFLSEYKNSATGYALAFFGELSERKMQDDNTAAGMFIKSLYASTFFSAEKPALTGLKEAFDFLTPTDKYGNVKILDEKGYSDAWSTWSGGLFNSVLTPNLFKQSNKIVEQVYGMDEKRATNWWQAMVKGLPYVNQTMLETQFDHFGRPIESKVELGFLGVQGSLEKGFTMLETNKVDPYYELFTDRGATPQWFTDTEIPIYTENKAGNYVKNDEGQKIRISKYEGHVLNMLIGEQKKRLIDEEVEYDMTTGKYTYGFDAWREMDDEEFASKMRKVNSEAKDKAFKEFFEKYRAEEAKVSNEEKKKKYLKVNN